MEIILLTEAVMVIMSIVAVIYIYCCRNNTSNKSGDGNDINCSSNIYIVVEIILLTEVVVAIML